MALFITLGLISRSSAKMLSLAQHPDYAQHLSVYAVSCTVCTKFGQNPLKDVDSKCSQGCYVVNI
jgi:hypothetical protein